MQNPEIPTVQATYSPGSPQEAPRKPLEPLYYNKWQKKNLTSYWFVVVIRNFGKF
jgi:hypothetical protein